MNYIADFMCKDLKLIIEVDGISHDFDKIIKRDIRKQTNLENAGFFVVRLSDKEVLNDINNVIRTLEGWIETYENPPPKPPPAGDNN